MGSLPKTVETLRRFRIARKQLELVKKNFQPELLIIRVSWKASYTK